ncbi:type II toxin-antitoxin system PemK/MazF family toxin [Spirobacillus cienkowskii]|jgi:mRNA-degrading endonuclease toxin of MazEF toxin-antitoxin module|uniref:Type II toxin-antitoxin system PemK/MazF family toxin n=1 Tax=Spirobacillus cienkowskii TaxID=495820 RepID=A0A369KUB4_9BACT|nr:MAG: type II toxin-antitoxin system PemK/MazF family toxin [Spirobacillus cienkowskii]
MMRQWDIWKIDFNRIADLETFIQIPNEKSNFDFCIIITGQNFLDTYHAPTIIPIAITSKGAHTFLPIEANKQTGLFCESYIFCDQLLTIHKNIFKRKVGMVPENLRQKIKEKIITYINS